MDYDDLYSLLKIIKSELGKDYPAFKRKHDVKLEIYRLQFLLHSPFLHKKLFNSLTLKLAKLEKEYSEFKNFKIFNEDYELLFFDEVEMYRVKYKVTFCGKCEKIFYEGFLGGILCNECFFQ